MQPHQQRVVDEKAELDGRLERIGAFMRTAQFYGLPVDERVRMYRQSNLMVDLSAVLGERIAAFPADPPPAADKAARLEDGEDDAT